MKTKVYPFLYLISCFLLGTLHAQTTVVKQDSIWTLLVNGKSFDVKGVTFGYDREVDHYETYFKDLKSIGVNTIRIWATNKNTAKLLDAAHAYDIKVMVGIWMRHGRPGMEADDSFNYLEDKEGMETMYTNALTIVEQYKNHPALLSWGVGNEVYLNIATDAEKEAYSKLLERICSSIKDADKNHPIVSVEAWTFGLDWWQKFVPSIDIYGLNSYGPGAQYLNSELKKRAIDKPYIITEFGVTGEWDIKEKLNDVVVEPTDQEKYDAIVLGYQNWIKNKPNCLGVYIFHYANGKDFIAPWLFTHHRDKIRPQYWAIREAYTGKKPLNNTPEIIKFELPDTAVQSGTWIPITLEVFDNEQENLAVSFYYNQRSGSRKRRDQINTLNFKGSLEDGFKLLLPKENGPIKIYAHVSDTAGNLGIATSSIIVLDEEVKDKKFVAAKVELPFYVYKDGGDLPFSPSAHMGNYKALKVDLEHENEVYAGKSALKIAYTANYDWYGVGLVDPPNDWGEKLGGYDLSGAKKFSFWAKASKKKVVATVGFGLIDTDKPFPDSAKKSKEITLNTKWKKYTIKLNQLDLSCIRSGLVVFSRSYGLPQDIYIDEVVFE
ncbi:glycoside hydrolase family 2 TIM barrel-domain containing protein [Spongiimicrobium salis]|uniref:glycoside hydrolase family 2 TIM barrel-domain containing protein n=1 Tax=Spongiimicrobium salis TaxID=1667022 RepID=UPI00374CA6C0